MNRALRLQHPNFMNMKYEINKPPSELTEGYVVLFMKYITLFIIGWFGGWIMLAIAFRRSSSTLISNNLGLISIFIAVAVIYLFGNRAYKKYKLGLLTSVEFDENTLKLGLLNTINGAHKYKEIPKSFLKVTVISKDDNLLGKQRIFEIYEKTELMNRFNIELTAWCRHPQIEEIVEHLTALSGTVTKPTA